MNIEKRTIEKVLGYCKATWAKWVIGGIIGVLAAAGVITVTGNTRYCIVLRNDGRSLLMNLGYVYSFS